MNTLDQILTSGEEPSKYVDDQTLSELLIGAPRSKTQTAVEESGIVQAPFKESRSVEI